MPGKITLDEALASTAPAPAPVGQPSKRITFDEASQSLEATARPVQFTQAPFYDASTGKTSARDNIAILNPGEELRAAPGQPAQALRAPLPADRSRFLTALFGEVPLDEQTRLQVIAKDLFPDDPKGVERVGIRNGKPVFVNDQGQLEYVSGPIARGGASLIASTPEIAGSIIGSLGGSPAAGPAVGGMTGRAVKRGLSNIFFDEPVTPGGVATELAVEGALNAVGGKLADVGLNVVSRGKFIDPRALNRQSIRDAERLIERVKRETGIELDLGQATGNRYLLELRDFVAKYPGRTSDIFQIRDAQAAGQFDVVAQKVLDLASTPVPAGIAGNRAINVAEGVIKAAQKDVSAQVQPLYDAAYQAVPQITDARLLNYLKLPYFEKAFKKGQVKAALQRVELQPGQPPDLRSFDYLKQGLDDVINELENKGSTDVAKALRERKNEFVGDLDNLSGDLYKQARAAYQQGIRANVEPLKNGLVGTLARMSPQNAEKAARIFKDPSLSVESIALLKSSLSRLDPDAYKGLVRQYLAKEIDQAETTTQGSEVVNQAGKLYQRLFGSPRRRDKLKALLPANALPLAEELFVAAEKLAKTPLGANRIAGSQTQSKGALAEQLGNRINPLLSLFTTSRQSVRDSLELQAREKGVDMIAEALTNPAKRKLLEKAVRIKDTTRQAIVLGSILAAQTGDELVRDLGENAEPGRASRQ